MKDDDDDNDDNNNNNNNIWQFSRENCAQKWHKKFRLEKLNFCNKGLKKCTGSDECRQMELGFK
jgi:hypothetical protein